MINFNTSIFIKASPEKVWQTIINDISYRLWTDPFAKPSFFEGGWNTGDKIKFLTIDPQGAVSGMSSMIAESKPNQFVSIHYRGVINKGVEEFDSEIAKKYAGNYENYTLNPKDDGTEFVLDTTLDPTEVEFMKSRWSEALIVLKQLCEQEFLFVSTFVDLDMDKVWQTWTNPEDIINWCHASDDWGVLKAENNLKVGGKFLTTMSAKDNSESFDFTGVYDLIKETQNDYRQLNYTMEDGRKVEIYFQVYNNGVKLIEMFNPEKQNDNQMQTAGWQAILDNFKRYCEAKFR